MFSYRLAAACSMCPVLLSASQVASSRPVGESYDEQHRERPTCEAATGTASADTEGVDDGRHVNDVQGSTG